VRLTIVNLFYPDDLAPSGHLAASLAEHRAALGDDVTVITGTGAYLGGAERRRTEAKDPGAVRVIRLWTPGLGRGHLARRLGDYLTFLLGAVARLLVLPRQDVVIALTSPPFILTAAVAHRVLHPRTRVILWSHDVYPDAAEAFGTIREGGVLSRGLRTFTRWILRRVDHVVAVDPAMRDRVAVLSGSGVEPPVTVIPTWEPVALFPGDGDPARWGGYDHPDLAGRWVVLHLGNLGFGHRTDTIAEAAAALDGDDVTFLFVGGGARFPELAREAARRGADNVRFRGYVPKEETPSVLAGAGCTLISLDDRSIGIMSPCKMNGSLAMGRPVLYAGPEGSTVDRTIGVFGSGISLRQGDVDGLIDAIRRLRTDPELAATLSANARRAFEEAHSDVSALPRFDAVLGEVVRSER
jgi:colanic acid biosynthesis glycosyl transferase WcaI